MEIELFKDRDLRRDLEQTFRDVIVHIDRIDQESILNVPEQQIISGLFRDASANCPQLQADRMEMLPVTEYSEAVGLHGDYRPITHEIPRWRFVIPFTGDKRIFQSRASRGSLSYPIALDLRDNELELFVDGRGDAAKILRVIDSQIRSIEMHLEWARADCEIHDTRLRDALPSRVRQRRELVQAMRNTQQQIGIPIRHRGDPSASPVPLTRKSVRFADQQRQSVAKPTPRWVLNESDYDEALRVLGYWRNSLERAPSIADGRGEEEIRDLLVAGLNSVFEGAAASEVFNGDGKTDILIRQDDINVFVGECKYWDGGESIQEALNQIFRYAVWHDTRTAILLFIRNVDVSAVIDKALKAIRARPNFVRDAPQTPASQYNFIMHAVDDPQQQIRMAFIPFALRRKSDRPGRS